MLLADLILPLCNRLSNTVRGRYSKQGKLDKDQEIAREDRRGASHVQL